MLTKLTPEQISEFWEVIEFAIKNSLPPTVGETTEQDDKILNILTSCMAGKTDVWACYERMSDQRIKLIAIATTRILFDEASGVRSLLIYTLYGYEKINPELWFDSLETVAKYAKGKNCHRIVSYSDVPIVIEMAKRCGGNTRYVFLSWDLDKTVHFLNGRNKE